MISEKLQVAVNLIKSGNKTAAVPILKEIVTENPQDENAWLWLYYCTDNLQSKKKYLQRALDINPDNPQTIKAWNKLITAQAAGQPRKQNNKNQRQYWILGLAALTLFLCLALGGVLVLSQPTWLMAAMASSTPLPLPTSTQQPTITPSHTPRPTSTPRPSSTPPQPTATIPVLPTRMKLDSVEKFDSYRMKITITMKDPEGKASTYWTLKLSEAWVKEAQAKHTRISEAGNLDDPTYNQRLAQADPIESIRIKDKAWLKFNGQWSAGWPAGFGDFYSSLTKAENWGNLTPLEDEIIQGIPCLHFAVNTDRINIGMLSSFGANPHAEGEIWIANQAGAPFTVIKANLTIVFNNQKASVPTISTNNTNSKTKKILERGVYTYEYELTSINDPAIVITPP